jgi:hypothetical protein
MGEKRQFSIEETKNIALQLGINFEKEQFEPEQLRKGLSVELEHGIVDLETNVTNDDLNLTGKIAWAHLREFPDYYDRLEKMEAEADAYWKNKI